MTVIKLNDTVLHYPSLKPEGLTVPLSLDSVTSIIHDDPARMILFARHYPNMPRNIRGVFKLHKGVAND